MVEPSGRCLYSVEVVVGLLPNTFSAGFAAVLILCLTDSWTSL